MINLSFLDNQIRSCTKCPLHQNRIQAVPGTGRPDAPAMLVAEKPGPFEDKTGIPMVGRSGELFDAVLSTVGLSRQDFFITNVIKCMPPFKHHLTLPEIEACEPWLDIQMEIIKPKLLVLCGATAISKWFPGKKVGEIHGQPRRTFDYIVVPTYHPAAASRSEGLIVPLTADFEVVARILEKIQ